MDDGALPKRISFEVLIPRREVGGMTGSEVEAAMPLLGRPVERRKLPPSFVGDGSDRPEAQLWTRVERSILFQVVLIGMLLMEIANNIAFWAVAGSHWQKHLAWTWISRLLFLIFLVMVGLDLFARYKVGGSRVFFESRLNHFELVLFGVVVCMVVVVVLAGNPRWNSLMWPPILLLWVVIVRRHRIVKALRRMVSKRKRRFVHDELGFDLDLAYVTPFLIAMGYPAQGGEAMYRNPVEEVQRFFETYHSHKHRVYNLCSERQYDHATFEDVFDFIVFPDHNPPRLEDLCDLCDSISSYLIRNPGSVVAVHCKAGKSRTGVVIAGVLLQLGLCASADDALRLFGERRTVNGRGVRIPSQIRYVHHYHTALMEGGVRQPRHLGLTQLVLTARRGRQPLLGDTHWFFQILVATGGTGAGVVTVFDSSEVPQGLSRITCRRTALGSQEIRHTFDNDPGKWDGAKRPMVCGDTKIVVYCKTGQEVKKAFHFWLHASYDPVMCGPGVYCWNLRESDLDAQTVRCSVRMEFQAISADRGHSFVSLLSELVEAPTTVDCDQLAHLSDDEDRDDCVWKGFLLHWNVDEPLAKLQTGEDLVPTEWQSRLCSLDTNGRLTHEQHDGAGVVTLCSFHNPGSLEALRKAVVLPSGRPVMEVSWRGVRAVIAAESTAIYTVFVEAVEDFLLQKSASGRSLRSVVHSGWVWHRRMQLEDESECGSSPWIEGTVDLGAFQWSDWRKRWMTVTADGMWGFSRSRLGQTMSDHEPVSQFAVRRITLEDQPATRRALALTHLGGSRCALLLVHDGAELAQWVASFQRFVDVPLAAPRSAGCLPRVGSLASAPILDDALLVSQHEYASAPAARPRLLARSV